MIMMPRARGLRGGCMIARGECTVRTAGTSASQGQPVGWTVPTVVTGEPLPPPRGTGTARRKLRRALAPGGKSGDLVTPAAA